MDIFVGGMMDDLPLPNRGYGALHDYAARYRDETGRPTRYFPNNRVDLVVEAIREGNGSLGPVNLVGHSYGGPDAYNAAVRARKEGLRVDNLITLDPVTGFHARPEGSSGADRWLHVQATTDRPNFSDAITNVIYASQKPSRRPIQDADQIVTIEANHEAAETMLRASGARARLDESRRRPARQGPDDKLPTPDWMKQRTNGVAGRR